MPDEQTHDEREQRRDGRGRDRVRVEELEQLNVRRDDGDEVAAVEPRFPSEKVREIDLRERAPELVIARTMLAHQQIVAYRTLEEVALVEATSKEEGEQIFSRTWYGRKYQQLNLISMEELYNSLLRTVLEKEARKDPYSVAVLYSYLYHKEHEVNRLTIALECVRYQVDPDEAMHYVHNN